MCRSVEGKIAAFNKRLEGVEKIFKDFERRFGLTFVKTVCGAKEDLSGVFINGLGNKTESSTLQHAVSCKGGVNGYPGGSYMLQQKFRLAWENLSHKG